MFQPPPSTLKDANFALEALRQLISAAEWADSGKLPTERDLSQRLGIGRHALRRALEVLETEGVIWRRQGAGTFLGHRKTPTPEPVAPALPRASFEEVMEVRLNLEPQIAQLAALRAEEADIARMRELNRHCIDAVDPEACELWDGAFHRQIALAARNKMFLGLFDIMNQVRHDKAWQAARGIAREGIDMPETVGRHHSALIDAIAARDALSAGRRMREHLLDIQMRLLSRLTTLDAHAVETSAYKQV